MISKQNYQQHYTPIQLHLPFLLSLYPHIQLDSVYSTVNSFVDEFLDLNQFPSFRHWPARRFPLDAMLKASLISFALRGYSSLRDQEELYSHDIRILCLFNGQTPSYGTIGRFQKECLSFCMEEIFTAFNRYAEHNDSQMDSSVLYLDGTKIEANANKMTFVWTKSTRKYLASAWKSLIQLCEKLNGWLKSNKRKERITILRKPDPTYLLELDALLSRIEKEMHMQITVGKGHKKHPLQRLHDQFAGIAVRLFRYIVYEDLADGRNSFSKTDPDATFMHMKYDYYNHTNVFKPGYNVQLGVSSGYIRTVYVSQKCNDLHDFIPAVETYCQQYGEYPKMVPADAGYGSFDNYSWCEEHGIELMMKYSGQSAETQKITDKNRFRSWAFGRTEKNIPVCPAGHEMEWIRRSVSRQGLYERTTDYYGCSHCQDCPLQSQCTRSKRGRMIQVCHELERMKEKVRENMSSQEGHEIMVSRSIQAEGTFGDLKENYRYSRLKRRGLENVKFEILMVAMGHNIRKFNNRNRMSRLDLELYGRLRPQEPAV